MNAAINISTALAGKYQIPVSSYFDSLYLEPGERCPNDINISCGK